MLRTELEILLKVLLSNQIVVTDSDLLLATQSTNSCKIVLLRKLCM